jgi:anionic cell wall polymer biosynthesis LytR-Cps2A-Psr (LCP) family protein
VCGGGWWATRHLVGGITVSQALGLDAPRSADGSMNVLLIGLDSRRDQHGNDLPQDILDQLHAGSSDDGGYNTNTLILAHIGADNRVVAFSIPRDDYVAVEGIKGYDHIKIKEAYGLAKAQAEQELVDRAVTDPDRLESEGREAGRAATLKAVRQRHGLDNGDLDRTHRQHAFLVSVMHQLQAVGTFADMGKLSDADGCRP